ncbi:MAG: hypothetical protein M3131_08545 [Actinomycetota bacterium]|nr:hypothetical protein [Actinomycetota bacterium]
MTGRDEALARVLEYRERGRSRSAPARVGLAVLGAALLLASAPLIVVLPEGGVPALLVALRLLAVEADWAAKAFAWIDWWFSRARDWLRRQSEATRAAVLAGLLAIAVALVWLLVHALL